MQRLVDRWVEKWTGRRQVDPWSRELPRILVTRDGEQLRTFAEARAYMLERPDGIQLRSHWKQAARLVMEAVQGGDITVATNQIALALLMDGNLDARRTPGPTLHGRGARQIQAHKG